MAAAETETTEVREAPKAGDRIADAVRQAAHLAHEARLIKSMARDAGEEGAHAARRVIRRMQRRVEMLEDLKDEAAHYVKRHPLKSVGIAAGASVLMGFAAGWIAGRLRRRADSIEW